MKRAVVCGLSFAAAICLALLGRAGVVTRTSDVESKIEAIEAAKLQYPLQPDRQAHDGSDDAVFTQGSGKIITNSELLSSYQNEGRNIKNSFEMTEPLFKLFGDTAVLSYVYTRTVKENAFEIHQHVRRTAVYQRNDKRWQLIKSTSLVLHNADREQNPSMP